MHKSVVDRFICCPIDHSYPLEIGQAAWDGEELRGGLLRCPTCRAEYPVIAGIAHLLPPGAAQDAAVAAAKLREAAARDADASGYDATVAPYQTAVERAALLGALEAGPGDVIVDLGAGTGRLTIPLARQGATVLALDISPRSLELNRAHCAALPGPVYHLACDACYLPLRDGVAHKVGSSMLLEHIPTPAERRRCLAEVHRVLRPGSRLALTAYNYPWGKRRRGDHEGFHGGGLYYYRFERGELRRLLGQYRIRTVTGLLNLPGGLQSRLLDRLVALVPPVAGLTGTLLFASADR